jgi:hydroxymethylpyrimidine pyrophosphatase-like HAD family hydrolase
MSKYQAIIFDLDGTAIPNSATGMPSPRLIDVVARNKDRIHLIAASGREISYASPVIKALDLIDPCIIAGGTVILDPKTLLAIKKTNIPQAALEPLITYGHQSRYGVFLRDEQVLPGSPIPLRDDIEIIYLDQIPKAEVLTAKHAVDSIPGVTGSVVPDWENKDSVYCLNVTNKHATKQHAVTAVLELLGVPKAASIGIGDGDNDLHLFSSVGLRIAMGNAQPLLKKAADVIAPSIDEDGLADVIEKYALQVT